MEGFLFDQQDLKMLCFKNQWGIICRLIKMESMFEIKEATGKKRNNVKPNMAKYIKKKMKKKTVRLK